MKLSTIVILAMMAAIIYLLLNDSAKREAEQRELEAQKAHIEELQAQQHEAEVAVAEARYRETQAKAAAAYRAAKTPFPVGGNNPLDQGAYHRIHSMDPTGYGTPQ